MSTNKSKDNPDDAKPGTSSSFIQAPPGDPASMVTPFLENSSTKSSPSTSLKAKNASRERPPGDTPESKRQRVSQDEADPGDEVAMDTDSSSNADFEEHNDPIEGDSDQENHPNLLRPPQIHTSESGSRRSSFEDEGVSTTIPVSSQRPKVTSHRSEIMEDPENETAAPIASSSRARFDNAPSIHDLFPPPESFQRERSVDTNPRYIRERTPAPGSNEDNSNFYFQRETSGIDVNDNQGPEQFLQKLHGKQRLMWARKLFFLSTELIFPGFKACSDKQSQLPEIMGVRVRSSVMMQALLYADALFFVMWVLSFLTTCDILLSVLKQLHGYLFMCLTILFIVVNIIRLRFGLKGNENDEVQYLALFWMMTVIVQIPMFTFIFLTDLFCPVLMAFTVTMDGTMIVFILLESVIGFIHFRSLLRDEMNVIRMARRSKEAAQSRGNIHPGSNQNMELRNFGISKLSTARHEVDNDSSSDTDSERTNRMNCQMRIRRLSETRQQTQNVDEDSDSSGQVTSTSDAVRQRSIRVH